MADIQKNKQDMPPAMILCGGQGTRLRDVTELLPKPMVPIGPHPIVWHIMKGYAAFGVKRFILCLGYKREAFIDYFMNYHARATDVTIRLGKKDDVTFHGGYGEEDWEVTLADTGDATLTAQRIVRASKYLAPADTSFFLTYGDAVANLDVDALLEKHCSVNKKLTVTAVHPAGRFGEMVIGDADHVESFSEKPQTEQGFISGGFMVAERSLVADYLLNAGDVMFEQAPMASILNDGEIAAYRHDGFWQCMDNAREHERLNKIWNKGDAPWSESWG